MKNMCGEIIKDKSIGQYILITPVKNEEKNLPRLIQSIVKQTIKPVLWVILDDGCIDKSPEIIKEAKDKYNWIQSISLCDTTRDRGLHLTSVMKKGFDFSYDYCKKRGIDFDYLSNVDADIILEHTFFENLLREFEIDSTLGVASGGIYHFKGNQIVRENVRITEPSGGDIVVRRRCFEEWKGITLAYSWESVLNARAKLSGLKAKRFENIIAIEVRDTGSAEGYWRGYVFKGKAAYNLNFNPLQVLIKSMLYLFTKPYYIGIAYIYGYLNFMLQRKERIKDEEIKYYFYYVRPLEIKQHYVEMLKKKFKIDKKEVLT